MTSTPTIFKTNYVGIYVQQEFAEFWIVDDRGGCDFVGATYPSKQQIDQYAKNVQR